MTTVKSIVIEKLKEIGADGLCNEDCGCRLSNLIPCGSMIENCVPAKLSQDYDHREYDHDILVPMKKGKK